MPREFQTELVDDTEDGATVAQDTEVEGGGEVVHGGGKESPPASQPEQKPFYASLGLSDEFKEKSPEDIAKYLHNQLQESGKLMQQRESAIFGSDQYRQYLEWKKSQGSEQKPEAKQEKQPHWNPPQFDPKQIEMWSEVGEDGRRRWKQGTPGEIIKAASDYFGYISEFDTKFRQNPYETFQPFVDDRIEERVNKLLEERFSDYSNRQRLADYEKQNAQWIYELDDSGRPVVGEDGKWKLNPLGQATIETANYIKGAAGDQVELVELARSMLKLRYIEEEYNKLKTSGDAADTRTKKDKEFQLKTAERTADRGGTLPRPGGKERRLPQGRKKSFIEQAREALEEAGIKGEDARWE